MGSAVQGSLDAPPIIVSSAAWKTALGLLGSIAFVALGILLLVKIDGALVIAVIDIAFFGLGVLVLAIRLVRPITVRIGPEGISIGGAWRGVSLQWSDITAFVLIRIRSSVYLGFQTSSSFTGKLPLASANRAVAGVDGTLPSGLTLTPRQLADVVRAAAEKWAPSRIPLSDAT